MSSRTLAIALLASASVFNTGTAFAQASNSTAVHVDVVAPLTVEPTAALHFGTIYSQSGAPGTVTVFPNYGIGGEKGVAGGVSWLDDTAVEPRRFEITGNPNSNYTFLASESATLTSQGGGSMTVNGFVAVCSSTGAIDGPRGSGTLSIADGTDQCEVGGVLQVPANVAPGSYTGDVVVEVAYQ